MENKNNLNGGMTPGEASAQTSPYSGMPAGVTFDPQALSADPIASPSIMQEMTVQPSSSKTWLRWVIFLAAALVLLGAVGYIMLASNRDKGAVGTNAPSRFETTVVPLDSIHVEPIVNLTNTKLVTINGSLTVKEGLIVAPTVKPVDAEVGQIYYDINSNTLAYFNGTSFVSVGGTVVNEINNLTGKIPLGAGLADVNGQIVNTGVLSVQGQTGDVTLSAGNGITINGTSITNNGVISLTSNSPALVVSNDGSGNFSLTLNGGGTGTITSLGGTPGRIAKFTTAQNIEDSLLSESGATVTVNGNLDVTGTITLTSPLTVANGGTGAASLGANGVLVGNGTGSITSVVSGAAGMCLVSTAGAPTWATCNPPSTAVSSLNGLTGTLTIANATGLVDTITIDDASTSNKGIAQFSGANFSVVGGNVNTIQNISTSSSPTFNSLTLSGNLAVQGGTSTLGTLTTAGSLVIHDGSSNTVKIVAANLSADRVYTLPDAGGDATLCVTTGNCIGGSGGAPNSADYLVTSLNGTLTNERAIASGSNIALTDGGANSNLTVATVQNPTFTTSVTTPALQSSGALVITSAAGNTVAIDAAATIELQDSTNVTGTLDVSVALNVGTGNAFAVNSSGVITAAAGITSSGAIIFSGLNCTGNANGGALTTDGSGQLICSDDDGGGGGGGNISGSGTSGTVPVFNGGSSITNSIITQSGTTITVAGDLVLTTDLTVSNGGTGVSSFTSNGVLYGNGSGALQVTAAGTSGQVLVANGSGVPTFVSFSGDVNVAANGTVTIQPDAVALGGDTTGNFVSNLGALTGLGTTGNSGEASTPTLSVLYGSIANTAVQGNVTLTCPSGTGNLTGGGTSITLGTGGACGSLSTVNNPTFTTSVTTPNLTLTGAGSNGTIVVGSLGQGTTYTLPDPGGAAATICLSIGNCGAAGTAGGDLTGTYPNPTIAKLQNTNLSINTPLAGHILIYNGTNSAWENHALSSDVAISETGVATIQSNAVALGADTTGNYVIGLIAGNGISIGGSAGEGWSPSVAVLYGSSANTAVQGNTSVTVTAGTNLTGGGNITLGAGGTVTLDVASSPTFSGTLTVQGASAAVGTAAQQGSLILNDGSSNTGTIRTASLGTDRVYILPDVGTNATICLNTGNCAGSGSGVTTSGGTTDRLAKFTGSQNIEDSLISDDGSTVTITGTGNFVVQGGTATLGSLTQAGTLSVSDGSSNTISIVSAGVSADRTFTLPETGGPATFCMSTGNCVGGGGSGSAPGDAEYLVLSLHGSLSNERALTSGSNIAFTDGGANGNLTVATVQNPTFTTSVTTPALQSSGALTISSGTGTVAIDATTTIELQDSTNVTGILDVSASLNVGTANAFAVNSSGAVTAATGITSSGTITFSGLNCTTFANGGSLTTNSSGVLSCSDDDGAAANTITGTGTNGTITMFNGTNTVTDSIITQTGGNTINIAGTLTLTNDLTVANGGTGASSFTSNGVLYGNGSGAVQVTAAGTGGQVLVANGSGVPTFVSFSSDINVAASGVVTIQPDAVALGTDTTGSFVSNLGALTGLSTTGNSGEASAPTLSVLYGGTANTAVQGNTTLTCPSGTGNLTGGGTSITLGTGGTCANLNTVNNPTFAASVTTPNLILTGAGSNGSVVVANLGQGTTYTLPDPGQATATICVSTGNCTAVGTAGGDLTGSYPNPTIAKLQGSNLTITSPTAGHVLIYNGTNGRWENHSISSDLAISETGVATIQPNAVALGTDTTGNYIAVLGALTGLSATGNTGEGSTPTLSVLYGSGANTAVQGNVGLTCPSGTGNLSGGGTSITLGIGGACSDITITNSPIFTGTLTVNTITPSSAMTIGSTSQNLTLQGNGVTTLTATDSGKTTIVAFTTPVADTTLNFPALAAGTYNICTSSGNCAGAGVTLQTAYNNSATPEMTLDATRAALTIRDNSTPLVGNLFEVQNNNGTTTYFAINNTGISTTGTNTSSGNVNTTGGTIQTNSVNRIDNTGNLVNIGNITGTGAITIASAGAGNDVIIDGNDQFIVQDATIVNGTGLFKSNSTTAFQVQNGSTVPLFQVDTTNGSPNIYAGNASEGLSSFFISTKTGADSGIYLQSGGALSSSNIQYALSKRANNTDMWIYGYNGTTFRNYLQTDWAGNALSIAPDGGTVTIGSTGTSANASTVNIANASNAAQSVTIGSTNTSSLLILQAGSGGISLNGVTTVGSLGATNTATQLCRNGSNQIAACNTTGAGAAFVLGGNSFGATAVLGTNDSNSLSFETNNVTQATIAVGGAVTLQNTADSVAGFTVNNSLGNSIFSIDTSGSNQNNLITNPSFETNTTGWAAKGAVPTAISRTTNQHYSGNAALQMYANVSGDGTKYNVTLTDSTTYTVSFFAKYDTSVDNPYGSSLNVGYASDGSTETNSTCGTDPYFGLNIWSSHWARVSCTFTTPASHSGTPYFYIKAGDSGYTYYIDGVLLQTDANADSNYREGKITMQGTVVSPLIVQNATNTESAFAVQNSFGSNVLSVSNYTIGTYNESGVQNSDFEANTAGWSAVGSGTTIKRDPSTAWSGSSSLKVSTGTAAGSGAKYVTGPKGADWVDDARITFFIRSSSGTLSDITAAYSWDGNSASEAGDTCSSPPTAVTTSWMEVECWIGSVGAGTPTANAYIIIKQTGTTAHTFYIDAVSWEQDYGDPGPAAYGSGSIMLGGVITTPAMFRNNEDSDQAFSIQGQDDNELFRVDTANRRVYVGDPGTSSYSAVLVLDDSSGDPSSNGINGAMYYNSGTNTFRCRQNDAWVDCVSGGSSYVYVNQASDATTRYYQLGSFGSNNGEFEVSGTLAGHAQSQGKGVVDVKFSARDGFMAVGRSDGLISASDLLVYYDGASTYTVWLKTSQWALAGVDLRQVTGSVDYDGTYQTTAPTGTLTYTLSTNAATSGKTNITVSDNNGAQTFRNGTDSASAFRVLRSATNSSLPVFTVDTTNIRVQIGSSTSDPTAAVLVLDSYNVGNETAFTSAQNVNGAMYYNSNTNKMRCYQNSEWRDCVSSVVSAGIGGGTAFPSGTTTSTTYVNVPGGASALAFTKKSSNTKLTFQLNMSFYVTVVSKASFIAINLDGTDYECMVFWWNQTNVHQNLSCNRVITGISAGSKTAQVRWKTDSGGSMTGDSGDRLSLTVLESD